ncbi:hypothetical protein [Aestuariicoccus sp. MJ-SS9]|uniref:hypothetical protein n=1 Tax=Aestuariicoccus sp. MJ-SS9 TaxID=3079855 RepID=UPI0029083E09|nr:hypothetical protein [Aestuariicoccus sp. MJ-SS9]MDU8910113.1 hypothetical protein [Aestuariicoccus sp. MJ-SS9]
MKGLAFAFMLLAVLSVVIGMIWGIQMSAGGDHTLSPAHAHLNLLGWVGMAIFAVYYHLVPQAASGWLAKAHFAAALAGLVLIVPGIVMAIQQTGETLAKLGSVLSLLSMLLFLAVVWRSRA